MVSGTPLLRFGTSLLVFGRHVDRHSIVRCEGFHVREQYFGLSPEIDVQEVGEDGVEEVYNIKSNNECSFSLFLG